MHYRTEGEPEVRSEVRREEVNDASAVPTTTTATVGLVGENTAAFSFDGPEEKEEMEGG